MRAASMARRNAADAGCSAASSSAIASTQWRRAAGPAAIVPAVTPTTCASTGSARIARANAMSTWVSHMRTVEVGVCVRRSALLAWPAKSRLAPNRVHPTARRRYASLGSRVNVPLPFAGVHNLAEAVYLPADAVGVGRHLSLPYRPTPRRAPAAKCAGLAGGPAHCGETHVARGLATRVPLGAQMVTNQNRGPVGRSH